MADPRAIVVAVERELHAIDPTAAVENVKTLDRFGMISSPLRILPPCSYLFGFSLVGSVLTLVGSLPACFHFRRFPQARTGHSQRSWSSAKDIRILILAKDFA